ncbi:hypothetical protein PCK1_000529 [Pneumocystis canis]|nr:hypothetical protein PCK1_000529 [Pneumocystis canis]
MSKTFRPDWIQKLRPLHWTFSKSRGPGGQNVNKRNTKVQLRVHSNPLFPQSSSFIITSQQHRTQAANRRACLLKLHKVIQEAHQATIVRQPSIEKQQRLQARALAASEKRLQTKRWHSHKKAARRFNRDISI